MQRPALSLWGWHAYFESQLPEPAPADDRLVRVSAHQGSQIRCAGVRTEHTIPIAIAECEGRVAVGDWLLLSENFQRVQQRLPRRTLLTRKAAGTEVRTQLIAANVDTLFIVTACNQEFNLSRLERYLTLALEAGALPVIVLTKADLCARAENYRGEASRIRPGLLVEAVDARDPRQVEVLLPWCGRGQTVALLGSSGVGKSTVARSLGAGALAVGEVRAQDNKGRHTTTHRSLHPLPSGGVLIDNPGMRELQLPACPEGIAEVFEDLVALTQQCRFRDCNHDGDPGCAVVAALAAGELDERRWTNFLKLEAEQARHTRTLAERRKMARRQGRAYKSIMAWKARRRDV